MTEPDKPKADNARLFDLYKQECDQLKSEQRARIGFRDNLLYATLGVVGGLFAYGLGEGGGGQLYALLLLPWATFILGWTYLTNDLKVSAIGRYLRENLATKIGELSNVDKAQLFGWEYFHRGDQRREERKRMQLLVDWLAFCVSPGLGLVVFWLKNPNPSLLVWAVMAAGALMVLTLAWWIWHYAELSGK